jgi:sulfatase modifying factor 1
VVVALGEQVDAWRWTVAVPAGALLGAAAVGGAVLVGGWGGVGVGAVAAGGLLWLMRQGEVRMEEGPWAPVGEVGGGEVELDEEGAPAASAEDGLVAEIERAVEADAVGDLPARGAEEGERGSEVAVDAVPLRVEEATPWWEEGEGEYFLINESEQVPLFLAPSGPAVLSAQLRVPPFGVVRVSTAFVSREARPLAQWRREGRLRVHGPDVPGLPSFGLSREELEDGPPQEGGLLVYGQPSALREVARPTPLLDFVGRMVDLPMGRLRREIEPREVEIAPLRVMAVAVTEGLWERVMGERVMGERWGRWGFVQAPVTRVSWDEAVRFCNQASELAGYTPAYDRDGRWVQEADGFRLPTEAEWEYACRAGTDTAWSWGDDPAGADEHAWFDGNANGRAHAVGRKAPNPWGLYDVHGNVWEWCWSRFEAGRGVDNVTEVSTSGPRGSRALRGGAFWNASWDLRSSLRYRSEPSNGVWSIGFRCVRGVRRQIDG